jgi:hypothetical protein
MVCYNLIDAAIEPVQYLQGVGESVCSSFEQYLPIPSNVSHQPRPCLKEFQLMTS